MRTCVKSTDEVLRRTLLLSFLSCVCPRSAGYSLLDAGQGLCALGLLEFFKQNSVFPGFPPLHSWTMEAHLSALYRVK